MPPEPHSNKNSRSINGLIGLYKESIKNLPFLRYSWVIITTIIVLVLIGYFKLKNSDVFIYAVGVLLISFLSFVFSLLLKLGNKFTRFLVYMFSGCIVIVLCAAVLGFGYFIFSNKPDFFKNWFPNQSGNQHEINLEGNTERKPKETAGISSPVVFDDLNNATSMIGADDFKINGGSTLLYYVENKDDEKAAFLIPLIESQLKNMRNKTDIKRKRLFIEVRSLGLILSSKKDNNRLTSAISLFNRNRILFKSNKSALNEDKSVVEGLQNTDLFLKINASIMGNLIGYQFILYKVARPQSNVVPYLELNHSRSTAVFIDPSLNNYQDKIQMALNQLIPESN